MPKFSDRVYGTIEVEDPLLIKLIESPAFQRLKGVNQYGGVNLIYPDRYQNSRFEHSLGVWHILKSLDVSPEIQIAGLLHDIGHTAFSHMVDQAIGSASEDFHEEHLHLIPGISGLNALVRDADITLQPVDTYPEIKSPLPGVGADRLDYAMRDYFGATNTSSDLGARTLGSIKLVDRRIHFTNVEIAEEFALVGLEAMDRVIYRPEVAVVYQALTEILRAGLEQGWLRNEDLYTEDLELLQKIRAHRADFPEMQMAIFERKFTVVPGSPDKHDFMHVKQKVRVFDPPVIASSGSKSLSALSAAFSQKLGEWRSYFEKRMDGQYFCVNFETAK